MVARLQVKAEQIGRLLQTLETKGPDEKYGRKTSSQLNKQKSESSGPQPSKKPHYIDPIPPFNANKIRKSPSASLTSDAAASSAAAAAASTSSSLSKSQTGTLTSSNTTSALDGAASSIAEK